MIRAARAGEVHSHSHGPGRDAVRRALVITASNRASAGIYEDRAAPCSSRG